MANILDDAIAEAKLLKEVAYKNAKLALEETFQPTLQRLVSDKIREEDGDEEEVEVEPTTDDSGFESFEDDVPAEDDEFDSPTIPTENYEEEDPELESYIRELEGMEGEEENIDEGEEDSWSDPIDESEEEDDDLMSELNRIFEEEGLGDDLDMGPNKEDGSVYTDNPPSGPQFVENRKLKVENKKLKQERNEALRAVTTLKKALNEVNLLNAKLMFTTKALRQFELSEGQKNRILNSFDRANSVREVKLVYTTIVESFNKKPIKKMQEGIASKIIKQVNPKQKSLNENTNKIANFNRLQELAGIKKN